MPLFPAPLPQDSLPSPPIVVTVPRDSIQNADFLQSPSALFVFVMYDGDSCRLQRVLVMSSLMVPHQFSSRQRTPAVHVRVRCCRTGVQRNTNNKHAISHVTGPPWSLCSLSARTCRVRYRRIAPDASMCCLMQVCVVWRWWACVLNSGCASAASIAALAAWWPLRQMCRVCSFAGCGSTRQERSGEEEAAHNTNI